MVGRCVEQSSCTPKWRLPNSFHVHSDASCLQKVVCLNSVILISIANATVFEECSCALLPLDGIIPSLLVTCLRYARPSTRVCRLSCYCYLHSDLGLWCMHTYAIMAFLILILDMICVVSTKDPGSSSVIAQGRNAVLPTTSSTQPVVIRVPFHWMCVSYQRQISMTKGCSFLSYMMSAKCFCQNVLRQSQGKGRLIGSSDPNFMWLVCW